VSMQERVNLVHGRFSVESKPGQGTRIFAAVPFAAENESSPEAVPGKKPGTSSGIEESTGTRGPLRVS
jgi:hypothetical protein